MLNNGFNGDGFNGYDPLLMAMLMGGAAIRLGT